MGTPAGGREAPSSEGSPRPEAKAEGAFSRPAAEGEGTFSKPVDRALWAFLGFVLCAVIVAGLWRAFAQAPEPTLEDRGEVPAFALVERSGRRVSATDLRGQVWIADFVFTRCSGMCPLLSSAFAQVQKRVPADVRLVSISVDPLHDTPDVLRDYAAGYGADAERWLFLTGPRDDVYRLIGEGFRLSVAESPPGAPAAPGELITHSDRFVLVDRDLHIRGYYHGMDSAEVERLVRDVERLRSRKAS